ncbi:MAG TPA: hypothetical protein VJ508_14015 [Saprospiraceae bacterium]|nr:hypothetical protein [Saprospiraceae bacterium]
MKKFFREAALIAIVFFLCASLLQTEGLSGYYHSMLLFRVYFWLSVILTLACTFLLVRNYRKGQSILPIIFQKFRTLPIPRPARYVLIFVFIGNLLAVALGKAWYPFYDVGMFRWATHFEKNDKVLYQLKYYYWQNGHFKILDLRKEGSFFLADHFGLGYSEDFMFSAAFRYRGEKKNFDFLSARMKEQGIDTLWVGIHAVNFGTGEVAFDPDICRAIHMNETAQFYYGPIYIPDYQMSMCHGH